MPQNLWAQDTLKIAKEKMDQLGMTIPSVHIEAAFRWLSLPVSTIVKNIRMLHDTYGIENFVMSGTFGTVAQTKHWAKLVKKVSDAVTPFGCWVVYHNHECEFNRVSSGGKSMEAMELFLELTSPEVMLEMDVGWAGVAGDELDIVKRYADRIAILHLKDFYPEYRQGQYNRYSMPTEAFCAMGEGAIKIEEILSMRELLPNFNGAIIIDQDKTTGNMLEALEIGYKNVKSML